MPINWKKSLLIHPLQAHFIPSHQLSKHSQNQGEWIPLLSIVAHVLYTPLSLSMYTHTPDPSISVSSWLMVVCCFFSHHYLTSHTCSPSLPFQQPSISSMQHKCKSAMYFFFVCLSLCLSLSLKTYLSLSQDQSLSLFLSHTQNFRGIMAMDRSVGPMSMWAKAWPQGRDR
jgi:hypothetical protein